MNKEQAISTLITAVRIGQSKVAYSIEDSALIAQAIHILQPKEEVKKDVEEKLEDKKEDKKND